MKNFQEFEESKFQSALKGLPSTRNIAEEENELDEYYQEIKEEIETALNDIYQKYFDSFSIRQEFDDLVNDILKPINKTLPGGPDYD